ncbi:tRNA (cytidine/uridine-2'-O-)-methyltransferase [Nitrincola sp. A-D6]|uniref:tRNA (cytosine(32)/uridine(32)-2'-O)-methyltransferase TrmJ n=1 Tax=Nitrincola sp. A-D6 TaxID=1545442 RepID=UPI00051F8EDD|nr:tRNA (cytosine(32)/uridine(32)-2'-O)-methyltransferase TrmJ [Nitrincola sp. A-D6]KGK41591.1 tRNA (cytidine/uridine-2'-O-)-methyltransferase [Nitrincola sp. A-D6]
MLSNIRIVLVETYHPGNIGAVARAMKNMGLSQLTLINPRVFPDPEATSRAAGAKDLLEQAQVVSSLDEAIADCQLVVATSARERTFDLPLLDLETAAQQMLSESHNGNIAILFGRETMGLTNAEMLACNRHLYIDANPAYPVLNISQAVQLVCYELWRTSQKALNTPTEAAPYPRQDEMSRFYAHLEKVLRATQFIIPQHEGRVLDKLKRFFNRARPEKTELGILRGILTSVEESLERKSDPSTHQHTPDKH